MDMLQFLLPLHLFLPSFLLMTFSFESFERKKKNSQLREVYNKRLERGFIEDRKAKLTLVAIIRRKEK